MEIVKALKKFQKTVPNKIIVLLLAVDGAADRASKIGNLTKDQNTVQITTTTHRLDHHLAIIQIITEITTDVQMTAIIRINLATIANIDPILFKFIFLN